MGMLTGGISGGIAKYAGSLLPDKFGYQFAGRTFIGGVTGGITYELYGGDFGQGFVMGATTAAIGFMANDWIHDKVIPWLRKTFVGQTLYGGFEGHVFVGIGVEAYVSFSEEEIRGQLYLKVCLGDALGFSVGGGKVLNPPKDFWDAYGGPAIEAGFKEFEGSFNFSPEKPFSVGVTHPLSSISFKFTPCWYFSLGKTAY